MSANNGIYVLESPSEVGPEYRVNHAQAIDNIFYFDPETQKEEYDNELRSYFGSCVVFTSREKALLFACDKAKEYMVLEYGISEISLIHPFPK